MRPLVLRRVASSARLLGSEALAKKLNIRVLATDRPGLGRSGFQPWQGHRRLARRCIVALADHLKRARFAVLAILAGPLCRCLENTREGHSRGHRQRNSPIRRTRPFRSGPARLRFMQLANTRPLAFSADAAPNWVSWRACCHAELSKGLWQHFPHLTRRCSPDRNSSRDSSQ